MVIYQPSDLFVKSAFFSVNPLGNGRCNRIFTQPFNFEKDSEIIVPSNTYIATILAILQNGFKPVLVEPDIETYNIDQAKIAEKITKKDEDVEKPKRKKKAVIEIIV